jgi:ubiquitin C-terminal hydrolase
MQCLAPIDEFRNHYLT